MKVPREAATIARRAFRMCMEGERLDEDKLRGVFQKIADARPRNWQAMLHELKKLTRLQLEKRQVRVESAAGLTDAESDRVKAELAKQYGEGLEFEFLVNPELLGGIRVRVGNDVWDGSVRNRLDRLSNAF
jgi:F-type H+-transporting ATPase subunit delta